MVDPGSGDKPPNDGASKADRAGGKPSRRGRGRRKGHKAGPPAAPVTGDRTVQAVSERRPIESDQQTPAKKRKRRRKNRGQQPAVSHLQAGAHPNPVSSPNPVASDGAHARELSAANGHKAALSGGSGLAGVQGVADGRSKASKRRRKGRAVKAGLVRPLQPGKTVQAKQHSPSYVPPAAHAHKAGGGDAVQARSRHGHDKPRAEQRGHSHTHHYFGDEHPAEFYAALDLGTNNCRLLIAQPTRPGQFRVVDAFSRIVRLGEGLAASGRLSEDAMDRAVEALKVCASKLNSVELRRKRLIATEACRAAANGEEFLARVKRETGLDLEIINRETEARLAVSGCSSLVGRETRSVVLFDIGGGSSEIAVIRIQDHRSSRLANHITHWTSLPVGVVTLSERHGGRDVTPAVFEGMIAEVTGMLAQFDCPPIATFGHASVDEDFHLIGTSGTVTTLAGVHLDLPRYDRRRVDGLWLSDDEVSAMQAKLLSWDYQSRAANACIGPDRADLVLAGCAILEAIRRRWPSTRMRVADRGLREGLLTDMMADDGVWRRNRSRRLHGGKAFPEKV
ncbi:Ppx/GppA phosphatase family protein [Rhizobium oryziradicis]|uniref:Exopolyphosphatase n=1 Tax=Rhizobium oryziradicis TaxID=1867956 RepID=A0A1Q8ZUE8_9HYPH|nr:Ppx/GppA phosphatase family protein [Rhizobium oryziradicis]OLP45711.1 exopolyphosphatase [Rhizobium oryziradicis]